MQSKEVDQLAKTIAEGLGVTASDSQPKFLEDIAISLRELVQRNSSLDEKAGRLLELFEAIADGEAPGYDAWFRAKVQASLGDPRPPVPHEQAMVEVSAAIDAAAKKNSSS